MAEAPFDVVVVGGGPGGYVCAIRSAQLGLKTALIEAAEMGGTCLNVGCIPSKALLHSTEAYAFVSERGEAHGIKAEKLSVDVAALMKRKREVVDRLRSGVKQLVEKRGISLIRGRGKLLGTGKVEVTGDAGLHVVEGKAIVLAAGSVPVELSFLKFDGKTIVSSDDAIAFDAVPGKLLVVGAGAIGLELGSVWARLGSQVTVVELLPRAAPNYDEDISKALERALKKQGLKLELGVKVTGVKQEDGKTFLTAEKAGKPVAYEADRILVAVGRKPASAGLAADGAGLKLDERKRVEIDDQYRTSVPGVFAIGDLVRGPMLAHKAEEEGVAVAELIAGKAGHVNYDAIPNVVYTEPEVAGVGLGETETRQRGLEIRIGKFNFLANGRAIAADATDGFAKIIADAKTDRLLGAQIVGHGASELIAAVVPHLEYGGSAEDLARTCFAHPTLGEAIREAALASDGRPIHGL